MKVFGRMMKALLSCSLLFAVSAGLTALDAGLDVALSQNIIRKVLLNTNGIQVVNIRSFQLNYSLQLSQELGTMWSVGGNVTAVNSFATNGRGSYPVPEQSLFGGSVAFSPSDAFQFGFDYTVTSSIHIMTPPLNVDGIVLSETMIESEPSLSFTFNAPFGLDWFALSATLSAGYYFSPFYRGWGASLSIMPIFSIPAWSVDIGIPVSAGYSLQGYRGASEPGFDSGSPSLYITWSPGDVFSISLSAGYLFSLSGDPVTRELNSAPFYQLNIGFYLTTDKNDDNEETESADPK